MRLVIALVATPLHAATTYWTTPALLKHFFKDSERVRAVEVLGSELAAALDGQNVGAPKGNREPYGHEIRDRRFLDQLVGKSMSDALKPGVDVGGVTGATISVKSTTIAARRALALCDIARRKVVSRGQG